MTATAKPPRRHLCLQRPSAHCPHVHHRTGEIAAVRPAGGPACRWRWPHEITSSQIDVGASRAKAAVDLAGPSYRMLDDRLGSVDGAASPSASIGTMHLAKGLEPALSSSWAATTRCCCCRIASRTSARCGFEQWRLGRHLLYVACTRARDALMVTAVESRRSFWRMWRDKMCPERRHRRLVCMVRVSFTLGGHANPPSVDSANSTIN